MTKPIRKRKILVILSNRVRPLEDGRFFEIDCLDDGSVERERRLKAKPAKAVYDEVWENDEGKTNLDHCNRLKRRYKHALLKPKA